MSQDAGKLHRYITRKADWSRAKAPGCDRCPLRNRQGVLTHRSESGEITPFRSGYRRLPAKARLFIEGERPEEFFVVVTGWAHRYKLLFDGTRQILDFVLPGDMVGLPVDASARHIDHSVATITGVTLCAFPAQAVLRRLHSEAGFASRMLWIKASAEARAFERMTTLGRYNSRQRMAHLLLESFYRLRLCGAVSGLTCEFPLTQNILADALGLSTVHVNRILRQFREEGLATVADHTLTINDLAALEKLCDFDRSYLCETALFCDPFPAADSQVANQASRT